MRIAYLLVDPGIGVYGTKGASVHVQEVVRAWRADGHDVTVFCTRRDDHVPPDLADLRIVEVPVGRADDTAARERAITAAGRELARRAAAEGFDLVHERYSLFSDAGAEIAATLGIPLVVEVNAPLVAEQRDHRHLVDEAAAWRTTARLFDRADLLSCVSPPVADWVTATMTRYGDRPPAGRVVVTPNGVNTDRVRPRRDGGVTPARPGAPITVGFVGTLKPWHGTDLLLRAVAALDRTGPPITVEICGTGPEGPALERLAADLRLAGRVRFHGAVPPVEVPEILQGFDIATAPYPRGEHYFSPLKVYEYLAAGLPVVASAIGTIPDLLEHGRVGVLVPPGDVAALATALADLADDPHRRIGLGRRARAAAVTKHAWARRCRDVLDLALATTAGIPGR